MTWGAHWTFETDTKTLQKSQFPKPLKVSDTDHWLVAARHEELDRAFSWLQLDKSHTKHAQIKFKSMKRDHRSRVMMVFTLNVDESKEDLVMGGYLPVSLSQMPTFLNTLTALKGWDCSFGQSRGREEECSGSQSMSPPVTWTGQDSLIARQIGPAIAIIWGLEWHAGP